HLHAVQRLDDIWRKHGLPGFCMNHVRADPREWTTWPPCFSVRCCNMVRAALAVDGRALSALHSLRRGHALLHLGLVQRFVAEGRWSGSGVRFCAFVGTYRT